ncbi:C4-dicarboxylate-binding periplasmic protein [Gammaproteobacteria bacterium]|nr:C4-dicarboxylate-binding periplasmic protein [Gammaproteobacteria bacterium]
MKTKILRNCFIVLTASVTLISSALAAEFTLNVNTSQTADDPMYKGLLEFKKNVEARTNGRIEVKTFSSSQLGSDEDIIEQIKTGAGIATVIDGARIAPDVSEFGILAAPYIVDNYAQIRKFIISPLFETWVTKLHDTGGMQVLSFNWYQGERHLVTNKLISQPSDLKGIRMRTIGAPLFLETVRAMGATPTGMPWTEVYSALQLKAIDAVEAQLPSIYGSRLYEVTKYIAKTRHIQLVTGLVGSQIWFDKLPENLQVILREEALAAGDYASNLTLDSLGSYEESIKTKGVTVTEVDLKLFIEATAPVYEKLNYVELKKQVDAVINE